MEPEMEENMRDVMKGIAIGIGILVVVTMVGTMVGGAIIILRGDSESYSVLKAQFDLRVSELSWSREAETSLVRLEKYFDRGCQYAPGSNEVPPGELVTLLEDHVRHLKAKREEGYLLFGKVQDARNANFGGAALYDSRFLAMAVTILHNLQKLDTFILRVKTANRLYRAHCHN